MYSIGEFSQISGLPVRTLRFYHEKGLLIPAAIDPATGYRSYDEHNLEAASVIAALRRLEFPLNEIADIMAKCGEDEDALAHLQRQRQALHERIARLGGAVEQIDRLISQEHQAREEAEMAATRFELQERDLEPMLIAGIRMKGCYSDCGKGFAMLGRRLGRFIAGKPFCLYYDGEYRDEDADFESCMPIRREVQIEGVSVRQLNGGRCVSLVHRGPYAELRRSYARVLRYVKERDYEVKLPTREVFLKGPGMIFRGNPQKFLTEIQLMVGLK